jgi:trehalose 6-phosphate phosphatase
MPPFSANWAFFLDIDGTLFDIAATPDEVRTGRADCSLLSSLHTAAGGALALVSGRSLAGIDELVPLKLPASGQHGVERRDAQGRIYRPSFPVRELHDAAANIRAFAKRHRGLVYENKGYSVALHYRLAPGLADAAHEVVREAAARLGSVVEVQGGKMVAELKPAKFHKGDAIAQFTREPPFAGRTPVFLGDDLTDEHGFHVVNRLGGHSVKVGEGPTAAPWRLKGPAEVRDWLRAWIGHAAGR